MIRNLYVSSVFMCVSNQLHPQQSAALLNQQEKRNHRHLLALEYWYFVYSPKLYSPFPEIVRRVYWAFPGVQTVRRTCGGELHS